MMGRLFCVRNRNICQISFCPKLFISLEMCIGWPMSQLLLELLLRLYSRKVKAVSGREHGDTGPRSPIRTCEVFQLVSKLISSGWGFDHKKLQIRHLPGIANCIFPLLFHEQLRRSLKPAFRFLLYIHLHMAHFMCCLQGSK